MGPTPKHHQSIFGVILRALYRDVVNLNEWGQYPNGAAYLKLAILSPNHYTDEWCFLVVGPSKITCYIYIYKILYPTGGHILSLSWAT